MLVLFWFQDALLDLHPFETDGPLRSCTRSWSKCKCEPLPDLHPCRRQNCCACSIAGTLDGLVTEHTACYFWTSMEEVVCCLSSQQPQNWNSLNHKLVLGLCYRSVHTADMHEGHWGYFFCQLSILYSTLSWITGGQLKWGTALLWVSILLLRICTLGNEYVTIC